MSGQIVKLSFAVALWACAASQSGGQASPSTDERVDFGRDVQPILTEHCLGCHGGSDPEAGLRLGDAVSASSPAASGLAAIVPGQPQESELIRRITSPDPNRQMPPEGEEPLTPAQIALLEEWIRDGAKYRQHWAFQPLANATPPTALNASWMQNPIDAFVLSRLEQAGISPSAEADRYTLIRRLYYDLLGLPPSVVEVDRFIADEAPQAIERLVDRLLASPHFGERWGRHWLDLAHYADSDGYETDRPRPDAYLYRDWVIRSLNQDMPFDQFTLEQLAGDLLAAPSAQQRIATGFLRQTLTNEEGGVDQEEFRVAAAFDRTETLGAIWLGLTMGCARCHDHKYDPLSQQDYYGLFAYFNDADERVAQLPIAADEPEELERELAPIEKSLAIRMREIAPQEREWESAEHLRLLSQPDSLVQEHDVAIASVRSSASPPTLFQIEEAKIVIAHGRPAETTSSPSSASATQPAAAPPAAASPEELAPPAADKDVYIVDAQVAVPVVTGFKLIVWPDERLPQRGPGWADNGEFEVSGFGASIVQPTEDEEAIALHRAEADTASTGHGPELVLQSPPGDDGWSTGDATGERHWIQLRTRAPIAVTSGDRLRFRIEQQHGVRRLIGRFSLQVLTGGERGLHIGDKQIAEDLDSYPEKRVARTRQRLFDYYVHEVARDPLARQLQRQKSELFQRRGAELMEVRVVEATMLTRPTHVLDRGDFQSQREPVSTRTPSALPSCRSRRERSDRLDLAQWIVSPDNPLTPRVAVNYVWGRLFGVGLVRTPDDFGVRGEAPTHPELLDWLAGGLQRDLQWSRKTLIRLIVTSAAYRQASHARPEAETLDPANRLLFRQNRFRVESEIVRDLHLAASGLLSRRIGGPSVFPPMPADLAKLSYANKFAWNNSAGEDRYRRGMYTFFKRTLPHPNLMTFDSPDANVACARRTVSNTPLQALTLLNNESHVEAAQAFAKRVLAEGPSALGAEPASNADDALLAWAWRLCVARPPESAEFGALRRVLVAALSYYAAHVDEAALLAGKPTPDVASASEIAAWTATLRTVLNLDEFITRE